MVVIANGCWWVDVKVEWVANDAGAMQWCHNKMVYLCLGHGELQLLHHLQDGTSSNTTSKKQRLRNWLCNKQPF